MSSLLRDAEATSHISSLQAWGTGKGDPVLDLFDPGPSRQLTVRPPGSHLSIGSTLPWGPVILMGQGGLFACAFKRLAHPGDTLVGSQSLVFMPLADYFGVFLGQT